MRNPLIAILAPLTLGLVLSACSPSQNWREITFEGSPLKAQLPCKPDRTTRAVPLGGVSVDLQVAGCESGGAMVAVMTAPLQAGVDASAVLSGWEKATLDNARVSLPLASGQTQPWHRPGMLPLNTAVRIQTKGLRPDGEAVMMEAVWGAVPDGERIRLVHAVVYGMPIPKDLANNLFEGVKP